MAHRRSAALVVAVAFGALSLVGCGGSKKSASSNAVAVSLVDTIGKSGPWSVTASATSAKAGDVTFKVKNAGTTVHELVVLKTDVAFDQLPVVDAGDPPAPVTTGANKIDEANNVGETGDPDLEAGASRTFTVKGMTAGHYVLVCNIAGHYSQGMRAAFTVS